MSRRSELASTSKVAIQTGHLPKDLVPNRILIVSDVRLYRDALALRLNQNAHLRIVGATEQGGAMWYVERLEPDLLLLDVCDWHSLELAHELVTLRPSLDIVALAVPEVAGHAIAATVHGIAGFVPRSGSIDDVIAVIERLACGRETVARPMSVLLDSAELSGCGKTAVADLTPREREILQMIELGLSNKEIARDLGIEVGTVKNHVHNILEKLHVQRRNQAAHRIRVRPPSP